MAFRLEEKIKFHISDYIKLKNKIYELNGMKLYPKRNISSIYFDNKNLDMFLDSEEGNVPRKKIRLRIYPNSKEKFFLIEKKITSAEGKFKLSNKKDIAEYKSLIKKGLFDNSYGLIEKKIRISYSREYFSLFNTRLTLDTNIVYSSPNGQFKVYDYDSLILEIKSNKDIISVQNIFLNLIPIRRERFSKYCQGMNALYNKDHSQRLSLSN